jgi:hypothetical protein
MVLTRRIVVRCGGGVWEDPHEQLIVGGKRSLIEWTRERMSQRSMVVGSILLKSKIMIRGRRRECERGIARSGAGMSDLNCFRTPIEKFKDKRF